MPEGDTIEKVRRELTPMLLDHVVVRAESRWPVVVQGLTGKRVTAIEAFGKHLLITFDTGAQGEVSLRVHLGMTGSWHRYDPGERWLRPAGDMGLVLETAEDVLVCFRPPEVERLTAKERAHHRALASLGPDLLKDPFDVDEVIRRARHPEREDMDIADLLLDQRVAAGIGNVYKCEALFLRKLSPFRKVKNVDDDTLRALYLDTKDLMRANLDLGARDTMKPLGHKRGERRYHVYGAGQRGCAGCGGKVSVQEQGVRLTWWCPRCQP